MYSRIAGTGRYLPTKVLTNADLEKMVDTTDEWIRTRTGIQRRHIASAEETTSFMATEAARRAMEMAGVGPNDVDFIAVGTTTPDVVFPNVATLVQANLGIHDTPAFSLETACSGFVYALGIADKFVRAGDAKCALVIGSECITRLVDWSDRGTCVLFGDGAGAVILKPSEEPGILTTIMSADGQYRDLLTFPYGISHGFDKLRSGAPAAIQMKGNEVFKVAVNTLSRLVDQTLDKAGIDRSAIDWLIPHQANLRIIQAAAKKLELPMKQVVVTVQDHGNTSAASIPLALDTAVRDGRIRRGQTLLLETFGGGFTWGSALVRY
ncbi:MAG TPA: beta-ketoacyl-ACP synthase III [Steroidobacteraceae bacterium]|nr:beta-ketoacyl-ACP synthase III [Steroidobacteraceae bacterium]